MKVLDQETRIGVLVERYGWAQAFMVRLKDGVLPPQYASDPEIAAAYRQVVSARERWQRKQCSQESGDKAPGSPRDEGTQAGTCDEAGVGESRLRVSKNGAFHEA